MESLLYDLRYAARALIRTPGWTSMALLTLALGTGANAAVFSFVDALLFKPAPGIHPPRPLVAVYDVARARIAALPGVEDAAWRRTLPLSASGRRGFKPEGYVRREGEDLELHYNIVSPDYFKTLGIAVAGGRTFTSADTGDKERSPQVVVVNEVLAKRFFAGKAIGRRLTDSGGTLLERRKPRDD